MRDSFDEDRNGVLTADELEKAHEIDCSARGISSLKGVEYFTALDSLFCYKNQLKSLDVSKNTALTYLDCGGNQLTSLDLRRNTAMSVLSCDNNQLTVLDIGRNTTLKILALHIQPVDTTMKGQ